MPRTATFAEIKKAFRQKSKDNHPDRNDSQEAGERMAAINEAHEVLMDEKKREFYDRSGCVPGMGDGCG